MGPHQNHNPNDTVKNKNKLRVFLVFLFLSLMLWLVIKLSENYIADVGVKVEYIDIPAKKLLQKEPENQIMLSLRATGYSLVKMRIFHKTIQYSLDGIEKLKGNLYFSKTSTNTNFIQKQYAAEVEVLDVKPDTLFFELSEKSSKKVPVVSNIDIRFATGFNLLGDLKIDPEKVTISGPKGILDTIHEVETEKLELKGVSKNIMRDVKLIHPGNKKVELSPKKVRLKAEVTKFTEGTFEIPVTVVNVPRNTVISIIPKKVKVTYVVPFSDFNKVSAESFRITADYKQAKENDLGYLIPEVAAKPHVVTAVRLSPTKIDYLVKE